MTARIVNVSLSDTFAPGGGVGRMAQLLRHACEWLSVSIAPVSTSGTAQGIVVSLDAEGQTARVVPAPTEGAILRLWLPPNHGLWASRRNSASFMSPATGATLVSLLTTSIPLAGARTGAIDPLAKTVRLQTSVATAIVPVAKSWRSVQMLTPTSGAVTWFGFSADEPVAASRGMPVPDDNTQPLEFLLPPGVTIWALTDTADAQVTVLAMPLMQWAARKPMQLPPRWL